MAATGSAHLTPPPGIILRLCSQNLPAITTSTASISTMSATKTEENSSYGYSAATTSSFAEQYGLKPTDVQPGTLDLQFWNKFRERQINTFVQRIALQTRSIRPQAVISAAVGSYSPDARSQLLQNWPNWTANKWIDLVTPMSYSTDDSHFGRLILRQKKVIGCTALLAEGIGMFMQKDPAQTVAQIGISRQMGAIGQVLFSASYCGPKQLDALMRGPYAKPAILPFIDPRGASVLLSARADQCRATGQIELADYYTAASKSLADYAAYRDQKVPYIAPELPVLH
jgi:hypothetical protein